MTHRVPFVVPELGADAALFVLHLYAALAEKEPGEDFGTDPEPPPDP